MNIKEKYKFIYIALAVAINSLGAFIALMFKLPVYMDTIGTIISSILFGPVIGGVTGACSAIVNGMTFDPTSFYFIPVQIILGLLTGILIKDKKVKSFRTVIIIILITIICSSVSSVIAAFVFDGITSSGSSIIVSVLKNSGISIVTAVFSTQILTDLLDKFICFGLVFTIIHKLSLIRKVR